MLYAVIMAGGQGTRLWPTSRKKMPKQLQKLAGDKSLIQETVDRILSIIDNDHIYISTTPEYAGEIQKQLPDIPGKNFVTEPFANGNAAACGLVSAVLNKRDPDSTAVFLSADHAIKNVEKFLQILKFGEEMIETHPQHIITIGIKPDKADTGLGYIQTGEEIRSDVATGLEARQVVRFVEKPTLEKAQEYVASGEYLWNSGMFFWRTEHFLHLMNEYMAPSAKVLTNIVAHWDTVDQNKVLKDRYGETENTTIDYGIMEKTKKILVIPGDFGWSDIGSWNTLFELLSEIDAKPVVSRGHHLSIGDEGSLVLAGDKLIATVGLKDVVVVDTPDALLVCNRHQSHKVKDVINKLKEEGKEEYL